MNPTSIFLPTLLLAGLVPLAGCLGDSGDRGEFNLYVTDAPDNIGDFASLTVTVTRVEVTMKDGGKLEFTPEDGEFDLTKLTNANTTQILGREIDVGNYSRLDLFLANVTGTLKADGSAVPVKAPSGRIFVNTPFEVAAGVETHFVFDIQVHKTGKGEYQFKPNADGSGPRREKPRTIDA